MGLSPSEAIRCLLKRQENDDRHVTVRLLAKVEGGTRIFPSWSMGYVDLRQHESTVAKIWPLVERALQDGDQKATSIVAALKAFNRS